MPYYSWPGSTADITTTGAITGGSGAYTSFVSIGATPATAGDLRLRSGFDFRQRNAASSGNIIIFSSDASDGLDLGGTGTTFVRINADGRSITFDNGNVNYANVPAAGPSITSTADAGQFNFKIRGVGNTNSNGDGGPTFIQGGKRNGTGNYGGVRIELNNDDTTFHTMFEAVHLGNARRITAINRGVTLTTTEMPANTGDLVTYIGNAATAPSANPVSGGIIYATAGALTYRGSGGTVTTLGTA